MASNMSLTCQPRFRRDLHAPGLLKFAAQFVVFHVLKTGQAVGDRAHVAAALHVVLAAQRIEAAAVAAHVAGEQREIDQREHIVDGVVMLGDAERPAEFRARGFRIGVRQFADHRGGHAGLALGAFQRVFFHAPLCKLQIRWWHFR